MIFFRYLFGQSFHKQPKKKCLFAFSLKLHWFLFLILQFPLVHIRQQLWCFWKVSKYTSNNITYKNLKLSVKIFKISVIAMYFAIWVGFDFFQYQYWYNFICNYLWILKLSNCDKKYFLRISFSRWCEDLDFEITSTGNNIDFWRNFMVTYTANFSFSSKSVGSNKYSSSNSFTAPSVDSNWIASSKFKAFFQ